MSEFFRRAQISEAMLRFGATEIDGRWKVRDRETGQLLEKADYDDAKLAGAKCRQEAAILIEKLFMPDRVASIARITDLIGAHPVDRAAELIFDTFDQAKK